MRLDLRTQIPTATAADAWIELAVALSDPSFELTAEEFASVLIHFNRARQAGAKFDPCFVALMLVLKRQMIGGPDDADADGADEWMFEDESGTEDTLLLHLGIHSPMRWDGRQCIPAVCYDGSGKGAE